MKLCYCCEKPRPKSECEVCNVAYNVVRDGESVVAEYTKEYIYHSKKGIKVAYLGSNSGLIISGVFNRKANATIVVGIIFPNKERFQFLTAPCLKGRAQRPALYDTLELITRNYYASAT